MSDPSTYNGGAVVAIRGKDSVAIAGDMRYGEQMHTIAMTAHKVFRLGKYVVVGLTGLYSDVQTVAGQLEMQARIYELKEERDIRPKAMAYLLSAMLYQHRFGPWFVQPIVCGIEADGKPYIGTMDSIGAMSDLEKFACSGTAADHMVGACEALVKEDMTEKEVDRATEDALRAGTGRDILSGWGGELYLLRADGTCVHREVQTRQD